MSYREPIIQHITQLISSTGVTSHAIAFGGSLGYAIPNGFWHHMPLILLNPVAYASYQVFVSQTQIINWSKRMIRLS